MNTKIKYLYRDADNYKAFNECVINGVLTPKQQATIFACLDDNEYFIPSKVGLPEKRFETWTDSDHVWFELTPDIGGFEITDAPANVLITPDELVSAFCQCNGKWEEEVIINKEAVVPENIQLSKENVEYVVDIWINSFRGNGWQAVNDLDVESVEYKKIVGLVEEVCADEFSELHDAVFKNDGLDLIFHDKNNPELYNLYYYNPDSNAGGQIVHCPFGIDDVPRLVDNEDYFDVLAEHTQYLSDVNSEHFFNSLFDLIEMKHEGLYLGNDINEVCRDILAKKEITVDSLIDMATQTCEEVNKDTGKNISMEFEKEQ